MCENNRYCWVVFCKNRWFHSKRNLFYRHKITLGKTDAVAPLPRLEDSFSVRCDACGRDYLYKPSDVLRYQQKVPDSVMQHALGRGDQRSPLGSD
jgi:hypothetical protein